MDGASGTPVPPVSAPAPFPVAADLRGLVEYVAERLDVGGPGDNWLELHFQDGRLRKIYRHEKVAAKALAERFA